MFKRKILLLLNALFFASIACAPACFAITLMTEEEALLAALPDAEKTVSETITMSDAKLAAVTEKLGGSLVLHNEGAKTEELMAQRNFTFHYGMKGDKKSGVAIILEEPGKWGPIMFVVGMTMEGTVTNVAVMEYKEVRGRPIASNSFLSQFTGKTSKNPIEVMNDITGVTGATISSKAAAFVVKKAIILYEQLCLNP